MNKLQSFFWFDERITVRKRMREVFRVVVYCALNPSQWKYFLKWIKSIGPNQSALEDRIPWMSYSSIDFLNRVVNKNMTVFEYGSGGSTLFFSDRSEKVVSIEHDEKWYKKLQKVLSEEQINNVQYFLKKPKKISSKQYKEEYYRSWREQNASFRNYVTHINNYEDKYFDIVSVDGRSRVPCIREAYDKVRPGGYIVLDNSSRKDYFEAFLFLRQKGCVEINFFGLLGYETTLNQTTIWRVKT